ncbi:MAG: aminotransferase class V-fold PLP-dependent enzyme [Gammaproteobacteria bacterium]
MAIESLIRREFPLREGLIHLNHAAVGPWPRRTADAVIQLAEENCRRSSEDFLGWLRVVTRLRERVARLINASGPDDIALVKNTSEGLSFVANGLEWRRGDNIVSIREEFISNRIVWEALGPQGVELRAVGADAGSALAERLCEACDKRTRLMAISSVQFGDGLRVDLDRLSAFCRDQGILLCVDAIQSLGALRHDVRAVPVDFLIAGSHKWLLSPEGVGIFYCSPAMREQLRVSEYGWHMVEAVADFDRRDWEPAHSARRFECGSPNRLGLHGLEASLSLFEEVGPERIEQRVLSAADRLRTGLERVDGVRVISNAAPACRSGIVTFRCSGHDRVDVARALARRGVLCAARGGGVRFAPHFHLREAQLDQAVEHLREVLAGCAGGSPSL